jgi:flagellar hook-length control protein FliK
MPRPAANGRLAEAFMLRVSQAQANAVQPSAATQGGVSPPTVPRGVPPVIRVGSAQFVTQTVSPGAGAAVAVQPASSQSWLADQVALVAQAIDSKAARVRIVPAAADGSKARPVSNPVAAIDPALAARRLGTQADPSVYLPVGRDQPADSATMAQPSIVAVGQSGLGGGQSVFAPRGVPPGVDRSAVFDQIAEALSQARGSGRKQELVLRLKPEHLGDLRIAVSVTDGVVRATLSVQNMAARNVLESEMGQLRQTLADAGLSVDSLEVSVSGDGAQQFTPQRDREFYSDAYRRFQPAPDTDMGPLMPSSELIVASLASGATVSLLA